MDLSFQNLNPTPNLTVIARFGQEVIKSGNKLALKNAVFSIDTSRGASKDESISNFAKHGEKSRACHSQLVFRFY